MDESGLEVPLESTSCPHGATRRRIPCHQEKTEKSSGFGGLTVAYWLEMKVANSYSDSDKLCNVATNPPVVLSRSDAKKAKGQRQCMIGLIRGAVERAGFQLVSPSSVASFSEHGSVFARTHNQNVGDIDVYVVLIGVGLTFGQEKLQGRGEARDNPNATTRLPKETTKIK